MNPFIRFTIGGNFYIEVLVMGNGKKKYLNKGKSGTQQITDVLVNMESNETKIFKKQLRCEIYESYFQLMEEYFHIEVWDKASWTLNQFVGYESILLHDIANGVSK